MINRLVCCAGHRGCKGANIKGTKQVRAYSMQGARGANINGVEIIKAYGFQAMYQSTIDSGASDITVQMFGASAGLRAGILVIIKMDRFTFAYYFLCHIQMSFVVKDQSVVYHVREQDVIA